MQTKQLLPIFYLEPQPTFPDLIASAAGMASLPMPISAFACEKARHGDVVLARVHQVNSSYDMLETLDGQEVTLSGGELIIGVLGTRKALKGFAGKLPAQLEPGMMLHLLNKGGVIGECTGFHRNLGWPTLVEYIGSVCRNGQPVNLRDSALPLVTAPPPDLPVVMVMGTCMNAGKTAVCKQVLRLFSEKGFRLHAAKVSGVACLQDLLAMERSGAEKVMSFQDFGFASTTEEHDLAPIARSLVHYLAEPKPDFILLEMGDGILGGYHVASLFADPELMSRNVALILCANDLMGAWGGMEWLARHGHRPALISGPVTDCAEGIRYVEENWHIPAANAFDCAGKICTLIMKSLMPWSKSA